MYSKEQQAEMFEQSKQFLKTQPSPQDYPRLVEILNFHEWKYYVDNSPLLSDKEYDNLYEKLLQLEENKDVIILTHSPSQRVSSDLSNQFQTVQHYNPMLSLANSYNIDDLKDFDTQIKKLCVGTDRPIQYFVEPKLDGGSIAVVYENDIFVRAATRGNGAEGDDISANAKTISSLPLRAAFSEYGIYRAELRGEAVMSKTNFDKKNKERQYEGLDLFANPRNAATGGLRMKDPMETRDRGLDVFIFQLAYAVDKEGNELLSGFESHDKAMAVLSQLGFKLPYDKNPLMHDIHAAHAACEEWETNRDNYQYEIDGAVVKLNDFSLQQRCGYTQHHPRWAMAFKFKAKQATTSLLNVEYQIGKTGAITPVAKVEPVQLAGVTVSSISLHNEDFIKQKDIRLGDKVLIERAGDVIPYVVKSLADLRTGAEGDIEFPCTCPSCNTPLLKSEEQAAWRCMNPKCPEQNLQKMIYHVSKEAMNIDGFGKSLVERFSEESWLNDISDIYNLDYDKIAALEKMGEKSASNLKESIEKAKGNSLARLLSSLSIHHLGKKASKLIAAEIKSVFELQDWTEENFIEIKDIGPVVAQNVMQYFSQKEHIDMLRRLEQYGVNVKQTDADRPVEVADDAPLKGKTILFTGSLQTMSRKEAQALAELYGAKNISAVSSNLNMLVVGDNAGSKLKKAEALGTVEILTEQAFLNLIES